MATATPRPAPATRAARPTPPVRMAYTRHATAGSADDRVLNPVFAKFLIGMLWFGGIAILGWILFGGFKLGRATAPSGSASAPPAIYVPAPIPAPTTQPTPRWPSRDECERHYALVLHEAPAGRCQ